MVDWTPWHVVALGGIGIAALVGLTCLMAWFMLTHWRSELADLGPEERAARYLGEVIARCNGSITTGTVDELFRLFSQATREQKQEIVAALKGLLAGAKDGPANLTDLDNRLVHVARRLAVVRDPDAPQREDYSERVRPVQ